MMCSYSPRLPSFLLLFCCTMYECGRCDIFRINFSMEYPCTYPNVKRVNIMRQIDVHGSRRMTPK